MSVEWRKTREATLLAVLEETNLALASPTTSRHVIASTSTMAVALTKPSSFTEKKYQFVINS